MNRTGQDFLEGQAEVIRTRLSNNRSVMPLDVRGRTRATLKEAEGRVLAWQAWANRDKLYRARNWGLKLWPMNEEFPVSVSH